MRFVTAVFVTGVLASTVLPAYDCQLFGKKEIKKMATNVFRELFADSKNRLLIMSFLNSIVSPADYVKNLTVFKEPRRKGLIINEACINVIAETKDKRRVYVDIQLKNKKSYKTSNVMTWAKCRYMKRFGRMGFSKNNRFQKAISIHLVNGDCVLQQPMARYHNVIFIPKSVTGRNFFDHFELHIVELMKFCPADCTTYDDLMARVKTGLDAWLAVLTRYYLFDANKLPEVLDRLPYKRGLKVIGELKEKYHDFLI